MAYKGGKQMVTEEVRTASAPAKIALVADRKSIAADGDNLSFITVRIEDKNGNLCPLADNLVRFKVEGAGRIAGVDNGNPATEESFQADHRKAFNGLALLIVRSKRGDFGWSRLQHYGCDDRTLIAGTDRQVRQMRIVAATSGSRPKTMKAGVYE